MEAFSFSSDCGEGRLVGGNGMGIVIGTVHVFLVRSRVVDIGGGR